MKREIYIEKNYLLIPVKIGANVETVSFFVENKKIYEFDIPVMVINGDYESDYYAPVSVKEWKGKSINIEGDVSTGFLEAIVVSDENPVKKNNQSRIHFTTKSGWINDPNGLVYHDGIYHLYFQHNPFNVEWGNMSWGHAVSKDLLHWERMEDVMYPDERGAVFSGCAIINEKESVKLSKDALMFLYTSAGGASKWSEGKKFVQKLAYSIDGGMTIEEIEGSILEHIVGENRDPKVYWYEDKQLYYMVLYLDKNDFAIFNSQDLKQWEMTQKLTFSGTWECPDLREISVEGGGSKWMFWTADGYYYLGEFDGQRFETDGVRHEAYTSKLPYAAQTYYGTDRVITIPWMRTRNSGQIYRGMMGIPRQLTLVEKDGDYILRQKLVDEYEDKKKLVFRAEKGRKLQFQSDEDKVREIVIYTDSNNSVEMCLYHTECILKEKKLQIGEQTWLLPEKFEKISFSVDGELLEITIGDGMMCISYEMKQLISSGEIKVLSDGMIKMEIYEI